ncbi:MAG: ribbon-helix-helix domain-containing protein [Rhizomicrobium sp.]
MTMSHHQFASITAGLLARKGDAAPSLETLPARPSILSPAAIAPLAPPRPAPAKATPAPRPKKSSQRVSLALGEDEYERLGIAAAKHHETRPQILRAALREYLDRLACSHGCSCIAPATRTDAASPPRRPVAVGL